MGEEGSLLVVTDCCSFNAAFGAGIEDSGQLGMKHCSVEHNGIGLDAQGGSAVCRSSSLSHNALNAVMVCTPPSSAGMGVVVLEECACICCALVGWVVAGFDSRLHA